MLRPIGDRILVKPEKNPEMTESGLHLVEHRKPETMGTVVGVGPCTHPLKAEAEALARQMEARDDACLDGDPLDLLRDGANMLRDVTRKEPAVKVGDLVIFSWTAGREVTLDDSGETYLMLKESDIEAVVEL